MPASGLYFWVGNLGYNVKIIQSGDLSDVKTTITIRNMEKDIGGQIGSSKIELHGFPFEMTLDSLKNIDEKEIITTVNGPFLDKENNAYRYELEFKKLDIAPGENIKLLMNYHLSVPKRQYTFYNNNEQFRFYPFDGYTVWVPIFYQHSLNFGGKDFSPYNTFDALIELPDGYFLDGKNSGLYGIKMGIINWDEKRNTKGERIYSSMVSMPYEFAIDNGIYHQEKNTNTLTVHGSDLSNIPYPRLKFSLERPFISKLLFFLTLIFSTIVCGIFIKKGIQLQYSNEDKKKLLLLSPSIIITFLTFYGLNHPPALTILDVIAVEPIVVFIILFLMKRYKEIR